MVGKCKKCGVSNDYQNHISKNKNCEDCGAYLEFLDEKFEMENSQFGRDLYKKFRILEFAIQNGYKTDGMKMGCYTYKVKLKSLDSGICYRFYYADLFNKKNDNKSADGKLMFGGWNDVLMDHEFINIVIKYFNDNPTIELQAEDFTYFDIYGEDDITAKIFELLNLK